MTDELEPRLRDAFARLSLPPAPVTLLDALERVPDAPLVRVRDRRARTPWGALAVAAVLAIGGLVAATAAGLFTRTGPDATGTTLVFEVTRSGGEGVVAPDLDEVARIIGERLNATGLVGARATAVPPSRIHVEIDPGQPDVAAAVRRLATAPGDVAIVALGDEPIPERTTVDLDRFPPLLRSDAIASVSAATDDLGPALDIVLTPEAAEVFGAYTTDAVGQYAAIVVDGIAVSVPTINEAITDGRLRIQAGGQGGFAEEELAELVAILGSEPIPFAVVEVDGPAASPGP